MKKVKRKETICKECGVSFQQRSTQHRKFCSKKCAAIFFNRSRKSDNVEYKCQLCGAMFSVPSFRKGVKYCSAQCRQTGISRASAQKRAATRRGTGTKTKYIKQDKRHLHRILMEKKLGRPLRKGEVVHHKDGNSLNNDIENLELTTVSEHARRHSTKNRICSVDGCGRKHAAKGYCQMHWEKYVRNKNKGRCKKIKKSKKIDLTKKDYPYIRTV